MFLTAIQTMKTLAMEHRVVKAEADALDATTTADQDVHKTANREAMEMGMVMAMASQRKARR